MRPLDGIRVLEMGQYIAAPYCAMMLADLGAEVIKIERPDGGDPRRIYDPLEQTETGSMSGGFLSYNRNKKSVTLDLSAESDRARYLALAATADVVVENLRPGAVDRMGVGYDALKEINPRLIYCAISGYGRLSTHRGVFAERPAFDTAIQAIGGLMAVTGEPGGPPLPTVTGFADVFTAVQATVSVLAALEGRHQSGTGAFVDQSMYDSVASLLERELMLWDFTGEHRVRGVDRYSPLGALEAEDGYVALILPTHEMWRRLCVAIERPDLLEHPLLDSVIHRAENFASVIRPEAERWTRSRTRREIVEHFAAHGLPAGETQTIDELYQCPHLDARRMFLEIDDPHAGRRRMIRTPFLTDTYEEPRTDSAPQLGEHNDELLTEVEPTTA
ncbi:formyl-CoA transferase [Rhodococcus sp. SMB37]|uniref:CaiB/BaiF CoA transferase family protein n=1 Tax=Rhodococcus sp. SMB37 TaxID=2512213 RepID=UPI0006D01788|nr:CoA transferase [Rhodococcus sp. SMB37]TCN43604.1 formyl-CoA transferase [Rhodococcus sp. SMB37]